MRDILPDFVVDEIRKQYVAGVADAEAKYKFNAADEDALTGALGSQLSTARPMILNFGGRIYAVEIGVYKTRGHGTGAPEKKDGNDGIFQIEVKQDGKLLRRKGLPFQAKNLWKGGNKTLVNQCTKMQSRFGSGMAINYHPENYSACQAEAVIGSGGSKKELKASNAIQPLGQLLGNEFLECKVGKIGLYFDPAKQEYAREETPTWIFDTRVATPDPDELTRWRDIQG